MESNGSLIWVIAGIGAVLAFLALFWLYLRARRINLTDASSPTEKPEWMRSTPPQETLAATQSGQGHVGLYGEEKGERVASSFAEQIEDIIHARLESDASLSNVKVDLGTAPDGSLEIWVDGAHYSDVSEIPNPKLQEVFKAALKKWEET